MIVRPRITDEAKRVEKGILCLLHHCYAYGDRVIFTEDEIRARTKCNLPRAFEFAIETMKTSELFITSNVDEKDFFSANGFGVSREGIEAVESWSDSEYEGASEGIIFIFGNEDLAKAEIPASDRTVTLDHNQSDYQQAVEALDKVLNEFRNDHRLDNELGHEKEALLSGLEGGRKLLNDTEVSESVAKALIVEPLKRLIVKYDKEIVGAVAATALALFLKLIGL